MSAKVVFVDDELNILDGYKRSLRKQFEIDTAQGGEEGLRKLTGEGPFGVVISDMHMPGMNGVQFLAKARDASPDTVRIMLTGNADVNTAMRALNEGSIFRFLTKPFSNDDMAVVLEAAVAQHRLITAEKELLEKTLRGSVRILVEILSTINPELFGRAQEMRAEMREVAEALGLVNIWNLELAAMLFQIGIVTLPPTVVAKIEKNITLSTSEQALADRVPDISYGLLANIPRLDVVAGIIRNQRRNYEVGSAASADIPIGSRILRVLCDLHQSEKNGLSQAGALLMLKSRRVSGYDPRVVEAVVKVFGASRVSSKDKRPSIGIRLAQLKVGHVLADDLLTDDGVLLIAAGRQITSTLLEKINNYAALASIKEPVAIEVPSDRATRRAA